MRKVLRENRIASVAVLVAIVAVATSIWLWNRDTRTTIVEGWAWPNDRGDAIALSPNRDGRGGEGYIVAGAWWKGPDGSLHEGADLPTCIGDDTTTPTHVRLGVVDVTTEFGVSSHQVVSVECLEQKASPSTPPASPTFTPSSSTPHSTSSPFDH